MIGPCRAGMCVNRAKQEHLLRNIFWRGDSFAPMYRGEGGRRPDEGQRELEASLLDWPFTQDAANSIVEFSSELLWSFPSYVVELPCVEMDL